MTDRLQDLASGRVKIKRGGLGGWFAGRARRREYWLLVAPTFIAIGIAGATGLTALGYLFSIIFLFAFIRRLHDLGYSGWFAPVINVGSNVIAGLASMFGGEMGALLGGLFFLAVLVVMGVLPGQKTRNEYGPPPGQHDVADTFS